MNDIVIFGNPNNTYSKGGIIIKSLQRVILYFVISVVYLDLLFQLPFNPLLSDTFNQHSVSYILVVTSYPLAFAVGSFFAGFMAYRFHLNKFFIISIGLLLASLCVGGSTLTSNTSLIIFYRLLLGLSLSFVHLIAFSLITTGNSKYIQNQFLCSYSMVMVLIGILVILLNRLLEEFYGLYMLFYIRMFLLSFLATLLFLLSNYLVGFHENINFSLRHSIKMIFSKWKGFSYLSMFTMMFAVGNFSSSMKLMTSTFNNPYHSIYLLMITTFIFSTFVFLRKPPIYSNHFHNMKTMTIGLLLLSFSLSMTPIINSIDYFYIPFALLSIGASLLFTNSVTLISEPSSLQEKEIVAGFFFSLSALGGLVGTLSGYYFHLQNLSSSVWGSLLVITISILYIREIHNQEVIYKL